MGRTPAKAGVQLLSAIDGAATSPDWTPAFAGVRWWLGNSDLSSATRTPAQAGVQSHERRHLPLWIPASAGIRDSPIRDERE